MKVIIDEDDGLVSMDYVVDQNEFSVETHTECLKTTTSIESSLTCPMLVGKTSILQRKQTGNEITCVQDKARFFYLKIEKCMSTKQLGNHTQTAQRWVPIVFLSCKKVGRKCILAEEHKRTIINSVDPTVVEVTEHLSTQLHNLKQVNITFR